MDWIDLAQGRDKWQAVEGVQKVNRGKGGKQKGISWNYAGKKGFSWEIVPELR